MSENRHEGRWRLAEAAVSKSLHSHTRARALGILIVLTGLTRPLVAGAASWQPVGKMMQARGGMKVTPLLDGSVLVTGGNVQSGDKLVALASGERFDPKTNSFIPVGNMAQPRDDSHAAARLQDGRVLVVGGSPDFQHHLDTAELFDPATGKFTLTGKMLQNRAAPTATLLPNGQVLVVGGWGSAPEGPKSSAELFDPAVGSFQKTGSQSTRRYRHSAVALADGRVAILGGYNPQNQSIARVEIYDPKTGTFAAGGDLMQSRGDASPVLLPDGRILVVGGAHTRATGDPEPARSIEIYDPAAGQSRVTDTLPAGGIANIAISLRDGQALVAGGAQVWTATRDEDVLRDAWLVDPATGKLSPTAPMTLRRAGSGAALLPDGRVLALGGWTGLQDASITDTAEVYAP
jgi:hypothetical protein